MNLSLDQILLTFYLALCETNLDYSIDSGNFSVRSYHFIIGTNSLGGSGQVG